MTLHIRVVSSSPYWVWRLLKNNTLRKKEKEKASGKILMSSRDLTKNK